MITISRLGKHSNITDASLDAIISDIQTQFPGWGNRLVYGGLVSHGIKVQFERVRESQRRTDPEGSILRRLHHVHRRIYAGQGPRYLWHIDGNHKLIRYWERGASKVCVQWRGTFLTQANALFSSILAAQVFLLRAGF